MSLFCIIKSSLFGGQQNAMMDHSQTIVRGAWWKKKLLWKCFAPPPPPSDHKKIQDPLFTMKITGQPHRKACKLNFYWKICGNFFSGPPLQGSKILRAPIFASGPPYKCLWMVPKYCAQSVPKRLFQIESRHDLSTILAKNS